MGREGRSSTRPHERSPHRHRFSAQRPGRDSASLRGTPARASKERERKNHTTRLTSYTHQTSPATKTGPGSGPLPAPVRVSSPARVAPRLPSPPGLQFGSTGALPAPPPTREARVKN
jgi:hypothetical protein